MTQFLTLDRAWNFRRLPASGTAAEAWSVVDLPHSPFVADLDGRIHWFGECEYQRTIERPVDAPSGRCILHLGAAMHTAKIIVDSKALAEHAGGFLPFEIDLTEALVDGRPHQLTIRLDNRDNPDVPPGKPYRDLDFCWYGGLYRDAELRCYPPLHITDSVAAGEVGSGGVFVRTLAATATSAKILLQAHVRNDGPAESVFQLDVEILDGTGIVARGERRGLALANGTAASFVLELDVSHPRLWAPDSPVMHQAQITLCAANGTILDARTERFGIRRIGFSRANGFTINGRRLRLRGTNRHQEYPYAGYALPAAAQRRDARLIKEAGFDFVRLSHYPQSPDFLTACDELGLVVMNCLPGWQFMGNGRFRELSRQNARDLIRRDRNHPCVVLWELSLNETKMDDEFMAQQQAIGHEEYPGDQMFTCGWQDHYDVFTHARQHGEIHRWQNGDKALVIAEYGDWEFYASSEGFDQKTGAGLFAEWSHGRKRREDGESGLRQQVSNHIIALNDTLSSPAALDAHWSMFDYARGYHPERAACGVMDIFRLPKFSYYFYRSQRDASESSAHWHGGPMVFIASHWVPTSNPRVVVFSNCDELELCLNGTSLGRQKSAKAWLTQYLPHAPFVFDLPAFSPGVIEATGYLANQPAAIHRVATPGAPAQVSVEIDSAGIAAAADQPDLLIAHARILDAAGTLCVGSTSPVTFSIEGDAVFVGPDHISAEAGVASVVIRVSATAQAFKLSATAHAMKGGTTASGSWQRGNV
ncbi:MAG TPA: glycoside hydrolase family 2 TIM barrel-domain containing protein [Lacunisphaera sp.]|jgi:beta-galactosidase